MLNFRRIVVGFWERGVKGPYFRSQCREEKGVVGFITNRLFIWSCTPQGVSYWSQIPRMVGEGIYTLNDLSPEDKQFIFAALRASNLLELKAFLEVSSKEGLKVLENDFEKRFVG